MLSLQLLFQSTKTATTRGFALIIVLWGLALLAMIAMSFSITARLHVRASANVVENAKAEALADAAVNVAVVDLITHLYTSDQTDKGRMKIDGTPYLCQLNEDAIARIVVRDEGGKVDLNGASPQLLTQLFAGFGATSEEAGKLAGAIRDFRDIDDLTRATGAETADYRAAGKPYGPKNARFETISELEQVLGMTSQLFLAVEPFITVHSGRTGVDPTVLPDDLATALSHNTSGLGRDADQTAQTAQPDAPGGPTIPARFVARSKQTSFSIYAEVATQSGGTFIREAIFQLIASDSGSHVFRSWERGSHPMLNAPSAYGDSLPQC